MTISDFKARAVVSAVNTCNGWGFGGWAGKQYTQEVKGKLFTHKDGKLYYRHAPSQKYKNYYIDDSEVSLTEFLNQYKERLSL